MNAPVNNGNSGMESQSRSSPLRCCGVMLLLLFVGSIVLAFALNRGLSHLTRHTLRIENRSSQNIFELDVIWPNGTYSKIRDLRTGNDVLLTYHPGEDGQACLLYHVMDDNGRKLVRYAEPGGYMTTCLRTDETWIIFDDYIEKPFAGNSEKPIEPSRVELLFKQLPEDEKPNDVDMK